MRKCHNVYVWFCLWDCLHNFKANKTRPKLFAIYTTCYDAELILDPDDTDCEFFTHNLSCGSIIYLWHVPIKGKLYLRSFSHTSSTYSLIKYQSDRKYTDNWIASFAFSQHSRGMASLKNYYYFAVCQSGHWKEINNNWNQLKMQNFSKSQFHTL